jgi:hypothetical protein
MLGEAIRMQLIKNEEYRHPNPPQFREAQSVFMPIKCHNLCTASQHIYKKYLLNGKYHIYVGN